MHAYTHTHAYVSSKIRFKREVNFSNRYKTFFGEGEKIMAIIVSSILEIPSIHAPFYAKTKNKKKDSSTFFQVKV